MDTVINKNQPLPAVTTVYAFMYNYCVHESGYTTVSLHFSEEGANKAMEWHKEEKRKEWQKIVDSDEYKGMEFGYDVICPFGLYEDWCVMPKQVLP